MLQLLIKTVYREVLYVLSALDQTEVMGASWSFTKNQRLESHVIPTKKILQKRASRIIIRMMVGLSLPSTD